MVVTVFRLQHPKVKILPFFIPNQPPPLPPRKRPRVENHAREPNNVDKLNQ